MSWGELGRVGASGELGRVGAAVTRLLVSGGAPCHPPGSPGTYDISGSAQTSSRHAVAVRSVGAGADVPAALAMVTSGTGLVTEEARPPGGAGALPRQRVTAEAGGDRISQAHR